jgi:uncharacterized protein YprB with RNaseH-like and TPR domain
MSKKHSSSTKPTQVGRTLIFDIETNGLLHDLSCIHCLVIYDVEADQTTVYNDEGSADPVVRGITYLEEADCIVGHNIIGYDIPAIKKLYPWFNPKGEIVDTLVLSRQYHADLYTLDSRRKWKGMPMQLYGRHSLEAYGYRLNEAKGTFGKDTDWKTWSQDMQDYCVQDVKVTTKLCDHFHPYLTGSR